MAVQQYETPYRELHQIRTFIGASVANKVNIITPEVEVNDASLVYLHVTLFESMRFLHLAWHTLHSGISPRVRRVRCTQLSQVCSLMNGLPSLTAFHATM